MDCRNCGAPMDLFERRRYYFCRYCGTFDFIGGLDTGGVRVLERKGSEPCPLCATPLAKSLLDDEHVVRHCERCGGVLVERASFARVVTRRRAEASGPPAPPVPLDRRELERRLDCPSCRGRMNVHPYYGPGNVVIDTCDRCDAIWIDAGELKQIADAPGRDRRG